jgi:hypothetical protein
MSSRCLAYAGLLVLADRLQALLWLVHVVEMGKLGVHGIFLTA